MIVGHCSRCARTHFPATPSCPYCSAEGCGTDLAGPTARLWLYTVVQSRPPGYQGPIPYGFGIVELSDGLRVVSRLTESSMDALHENQSMRLVIDTLSMDADGQAVQSYAFAPEAEA